jgi:hypothetical protein
MKTLPNDNAFCAENVSEGLTKREYFAAFAMQALIAASQSQIHNPSEGCELAVQWADTLIFELNKDAQ